MSVKTRFADVLIGQILVVLALASLCYRDSMIFCAVTIMFTAVPIAVDRASLMSVLCCPFITASTAGAFDSVMFTLIIVSKLFFQPFWSYKSATTRQPPSSLLISQLQSFLSLFKSHDTKNLSLEDL